MTRSPHACSPVSSRSGALAAFVAACSRRGRLTVRGAATVAPSAPASAAAAERVGRRRHLPDEPAVGDARRPGRDGDDRDVRGAIVIKVEGSLGPNAAGNFVALASCGYYDGVIFHRLVPGFVIQGGDGQYGRQPNVDPAHVGSGGPGYAFPDDPVNVPYGAGDGRDGPDSGPNTNGSPVLHRPRGRRPAAPNTRSSAT